MGDRLVTIDRGRKMWAAVGEGRAGSSSNNVAWVEVYLHIKWHLDPSSRLATIDMGRKVGRGAAVPLLVGAGSPCNTSGLGRGLGLPSYQLAS